MQTAMLLQRESSKEFAHARNRAKKAAINKPELAIEWCHFAASVAWKVNPGFFYCQEMEQLLADIGRRYLKPTPNPGATPRSLRRFLHLMTGAYKTGGHTRVATRWIDTCAQHAPSEYHSVLISRQDDELPAWLSQSVRRSGGEFIELPFEMPWLQKAEVIRSRCMAYDAIILHIHPNDPLPNVALYDRPRPVMFFNHADHGFTLGTEVATVIADIRLAGQDISIGYRASGPRKCLVPIPLTDDRPSPSDKVEARRRLGLPIDAPIALTLGEWFKYQPALGYNFPEALSAICKSDPRIVIVAIGISRSDIEGLSELNGLDKQCFRPVGFVHDSQILDLYYSAADIYLDCFPCGSLTSLLDAARHALPVQRLNNDVTPLLRNDDLAMDSVLTAASSVSEYVAGALEWLRGSERNRTELGSRFRASVQEEHCGASWKEMA